MAEQYELDRKAKMTMLERESEDRRRLIQSQRIAEDMRVLQIDTSLGGWLIRRNVRAITKETKAQLIRIPRHVHGLSPKTSAAANARRNNEKALNILLSAIPDRHLLSFHDAEDAKTLWSAIKARFGEDANLKFLEKPTISVACVYEHELKGVSNSSSQNIAFLSTEIKGSTLKQSTADPENIPKGYTQAASSKVQTAPNCASHSDEIICSFFAQQASMPTTHDDEDLLQIDEDAMEEIDIRWQVAMITARIRKFMRKTGRHHDLKAKEWGKKKKSLLTSQRLNALIVKSWVILLGSADLINIRKTEQMVVRKRRL
ncbi:hypothetical protein Tco_0360394 [Tanacetum coccineum]